MQALCVDLALVSMVQVCPQGNALKRQRLSFLYTQG